MNLVTKFAGTILVLLVISGIAQAQTTKPITTEQPTQEVVAALSSARDEVSRVTTELGTAESVAAQQFDKSPDAKPLADQLRQAEAKVESARTNGTPQQRIDAIGARNTLSLKIDGVRNSFLGQDPDVVRLRKEMQIAQSKLAQAQKAVDAFGPKYRGRNVTDAWIDAIFKELASQYSVLDGIVTDVWHQQHALKDPNPPTMQIEPPQIGALRMTNSTIVGYMDVPRISQKLEDGSIICDRPFNRTGPFIQTAMTFRIVGLDSKGMADDQRIEGSFVYTGTFTFTTTIGTLRTIQSYSVMKTPTRDEFVAAISAGMILVRHHESIKEGKIYDIPVP